MTFRPHADDIANGVHHKSNYLLDINASTQASSISFCTFEGGPNGIRCINQGSISFLANYWGDGIISKGFWIPGLAVAQGDYIYPSASVTGDATASSADLTNVSSTDALYVGQKVTIIGAGVSGANLTTRIAAISGTTVTLRTAASASVTGSGVYYGAYAGHAFRATVAGTTGSTQPAWPTAKLATVADNTATWMNYGSCAWIDASTATGETGKSVITIDGGIVFNGICSVLVRRSAGLVGAMNVRGVHFAAADYFGQFNGIGSLRVEGNQLNDYTNLGFELLGVGHSGHNHVFEGNYTLSPGALADRADVVVSTNSTNVAGIVRGTSILTGIGKGRLAYQYTQGGSEVFALPRHLQIGNGAIDIRSGTNTPEGAVTAPVGSLYLRTNGGAATTLYVKESGSGNIGWVPSGLTISATDKILGRQSAGSGTVEEITCTSAGRALLDDANAGEQRTTLGLKRAIAFHCAGIPSNGEVLGGGIAPYAMTLAAGNSSCKALAGATGAVTLLIKKNGTQIGSIDFAAAATVGSVSFIDSSVSAGDHVTIHNAATADATLADIDGLLAE